MWLAIDPGQYFPYIAAMKKTVPTARSQALYLLTQVLGKNRQLEDILDEGLKGLTVRDRSLARAITSTTLRHLGILDYLIDRMLDRPLPEKAHSIRHILRIGMAQILYLKIPSHAAVHDTVALVPEKSKFKGLVNALLRRTDRQGTKLLGKMDLARSNLPDWLWKDLCDFYGKEMAQDIGLAHLNEAPLDFSIKEDPEKWADELEGVLLPTGSVRKSAGGAITGLPGFEEGAWWVQDASAAIPATLFPDLKGKRVLDLCAAPGGKTAQLAAKGADVTALDRSKGRLKKLNENMQRLSLEVTTVVADGTLYEAEELFDAILIDAPCSSTGTIRRHPDVAWLKSKEDVVKLAELQRRLLDHAVSLIKPGGTLIYSTCSLQAEEGEQQISAFAKNHPAMTRQPIHASEVGGLSEIINEDGDIRCLPCHMNGADPQGLGGMDGFFVSRFIKKP